MQEDGAFHDVTTLQIPRIAQQHASARLLVKQKGVFSGGDLIGSLFRLLDPQARVKILIPDGRRVKPKQVAARITAKSSALLAGERLLLNLVGHMSGIATLSDLYCQAIKGTKAVITDTRKTTPLWRDLEKYAVECGGGLNHRFSLSDAILVKDNHHQILMRQKLSPEDVYNESKLRSKKRNWKFVCMEATNDAQVWGAIRSRVDIILLDNMPLNQIKGSMELIFAARKAFGTSFPLAEVSGGVNLTNVRKFAELGVDRISVGALTHSAPALDISLEVN